MMAEDSDIDVDAHLLRAKLLHNYVIEAYPQGTYTNSLRNSLFVALCDVELELQGAIILLVASRQHFGSALALLRTVIETSLRAFWTLFCAEDERLILIAKNESNFPGFEHCRRAVEKFFADQQHPGSFQMSATFVTQLHGLTHTGIEAIQFRFDKNLNVKPTYPDKLICTLLSQASMYLTMTAIAHVQMIEGNDAPQNDRFTKKFLELFRAED